MVFNFYLHHLGGALIRMGIYSDTQRVFCCSSSDLSSVCSVRMPLVRHFDHRVYTRLSYVPPATADPTFKWFETSETPGTAQTICSASSR
jgi:hypothetical protein